MKVRVEIWIAYEAGRQRTAVIEVPGLLVARQLADWMKKWAFGMLNPRRMPSYAGALQAPAGRRQSKHRGNGNGRKG